MKESGSSVVEEVNTLELNKMHYKELINSTINNISSINSLRQIYIFAKEKQTRTSN